MPMTREQAMARLLSPWARACGLPVLQALLIDRSFQHVDTECWEWLGCVKPNGYGRITIDGKQYHVHRVALSAFVGIDAPPDIDVCHECDFRRCINPDHLFLGTRLDNMLDAKAKGRLSVGPAHGALVSAGRAKRRVTQ